MVPTNPEATVNRSSQIRGFTLIELLVVIAAIGILTALLLPAVQAARASARRTQCQNNLKQVILALQTYHDSHKVFPAGSIPSSSPFIWDYSWGVMLYLLPQLEQEAAYESVDFNDPRNCGLVLKDIQAASKPSPTAQYFEFLNCPDDPNTEFGLLSGPTGPLPLSGDCGYLYPGSYLGVSGDTLSTAPPGYVLGCNGIDINNGGNGVLYSKSKTKLADVSDGTSTTMAFGERGIPRDLGWGWLICGGSECEQYLGTELGLAPGANVISWAGGGIYLKRFWSWHSGGAHFAFVDGSVHFVSYSTDHTIFKALSTRASGEVVQAAAVMASDLAHHVSLFVDRILNAKKTGIPNPINTSPVNDSSGLLR